MGAVLYFVLINALLGVGLAMDAFSVSLADGLGESGKSPGRMCATAGVYAGFQFLMPMLGWVAVHFALGLFEGLSGFIPWIALGLLLWIGGKMLVEGLRERCPPEAESVEPGGGLSASRLLLQGIATSIDALSVGFTIAEYGAAKALSAALIIAAVTFLLCLAGVRIGKAVGTKLRGRASILGGVILICIGIEIFVSSFFG